MAEALSRVKERLGHSLPDEYLSLLADDRLGFGINHDDWSRRWLEICLTRPPALLCSPPWATVEWFTPREADEWQAPEYWVPGRYVAFADDGYGNEWCWWPELAADGRLPVVFCEHDQNEAEVYGGDFVAFLQRVMLEGFSYQTADSLASFGGSEPLKRHLALCVDAVASHVGAAWERRLRGLLERELVQSTTDPDRWYLLDDAALAQVLRDDDVLRGGGGSKFKHMLP